MTNSKATKKALLASVMALVLCFSMLLGTTYAWFTDSVTSAGNIIQSGTLEVGMYWADGTKAVPTLDPKDTAWTNAASGEMFTSRLWEPGYVDVKHIMIANEGTLALKYALSIEANGEVSILSDVIDVYFLDGATQIANRTDLSEDDKIGTLTEVLAGLKTGEFGTGTLKAGDEVAITLALKMQETAGNDYQDKSIGSDFAVKLLATQLDSETDSFDNQYDKDAKEASFWSGTAVTPTADANGVYQITTADEFVGFANLVNNGKKTAKAVLTCNVDLMGADWTPIVTDINQPGYSGTFDGQGHTVYNFNSVNMVSYGCGGLFGYVTGTVKNLNVEGAFVRSSYDAGAIAGYSYGDIINCHAKNCTVISSQAGGITGLIASADVKDCSVTNCEIYGANGAGGLVGITMDKNTNVINNSVNNSTVVSKKAVEDVYWHAATGDSKVENNTLKGNDVTSYGSKVRFVTTAADFLAYSGSVFTLSANTSGEAIIYILKDIDLAGAEFSSIVAKDGVKLTVVGNGHTISNVNVVSSAENDNGTGQAGMFYAYQHSALSISDLTLENITVTADESGSGYAAAVVGYGEGALVLDNVDVVNATIIGYKSSSLLVGQLCAYSSVVATNCDVSGTVTLLSTTLEPDGHYAGKLIGSIAGPATLTGCTADATVSGALHANNVGDVYGRITGEGTLTEN